MPNLKGEFQISNIASAIATVRNLNSINVSNANIKMGISKIKLVARLQEITQTKKSCKKIDYILMDLTIL